MSDVRAVLAQPHVTRVLSGTLMARTHVPMLTIAIPLHIRATGGTLLDAGLALGVSSAASVVGSPLLGRAVDRRGHVKVLLFSGIGTLLGLGIAATVPFSPLLLAAIAIAGILSPPLEPALRAMWPRLVPDRLLVPALAVDSSTQQLIFVFGPLLATACIALGNTSLAFGGAGCVLLLGTAILLSSGIRPRSPSDSSDERSWLGPLTDPAIRILLVSMAGLGAAIGAFNLFALSGAAAPVAPGVLLALHAMGALAGGLAAARLSGPPSRILPWSLGALTVVYLVMGAIPSVATAVPLGIFAGALLSPTLTSAFHLVGTRTAQAEVAEAFAWLVALMTAGVACGSALAGLVADQPGAPALVGAAALLGGALNLTANSQRIRGSVTVAPEASA